MNLVWFKDLKFAPPQAALIDFNVANFKPTTLVSYPDYSRPGEAAQEFWRRGA